MALPNLRVDQHAQILGFSIIGYGFSFLFQVVGPLLLSRDLVSSAKLPDLPMRDPTDYFTPFILTGLLAFAFCVLAGLIIRNAFPRPRTIGVVFAILSFGFFPLGTLLSIYTLTYVFIIYEREEGASPDDGLKLN
jgi:hypothetical protein